METSKTFYDVEHYGDIEPIRDAIIETGGKITYQNFDYESEQVEFVVEHDNIINFWDKVQKKIDQYYGN